MVLLKTGFKPDFMNEISNSDSDEYEKFIAAFFNSAEDLNACFWESYKAVLKDWKEWETKDRIDIPQNGRNQSLVAS